MKIYEGTHHRDRQGQQVHVWGADPDDRDLLQVRFEDGFEVTVYDTELVDYPVELPDGSPATFVNVYEIDRRCGGPEEGGWWYDTGEPVKSIICTTHEEAEEVREMLRTEYVRSGKRYSVLGGEDYDVFIEPHPAKAWPEGRPRYE